MAFRLPTREEINAKIDKEGVESLTKLEEFIYDEEPDIQDKPHLWRKQLEEALHEIIDEQAKKIMWDIGQSQYNHLDD